jgi:hypothetical protein
MPPVQETQLTVKCPLTLQDSLNDQLLSIEPGRIWDWSPIGRLMRESLDRSGLSDSIEGGLNCHDIRRIGLGFQLMIGVNLKSDEGNFPQLELIVFADLFEVSIVKIEYQFKDQDSLLEPCWKKKPNPYLEH